MKMCQPHWEKLKEKIKEASLDRFVSSDGKQAVERLNADLQGTNIDNKPQDPLMAATMAIYSNALTYGGLYLMTGDFCPLCECRDAYKKNMSIEDQDENWIEFAVRDQIELFKEKGWIKEPSIQ